MPAIIPTAQQRKHVMTAYEKIKNREMVYLAGGPNGKTMMVHYAIESNRLVQAKHPEDNSIRFLKGLGYGRSDVMTIYSVMRQVLQALSIKPAHGHWNLQKQFEDQLAERNAKREVVCISCDNSDLLPARAYTIFKHLNELRVDQKNVGCAVLVAGQFSKMKMPIEFFYRCTELKIEKLYPADLATLIDMHWPGMSRSFDEKAIECILSNSNQSLLEARRHLELVIRKKREYDMDKVTLPLVHRALALAA
jgi:hypothetical protein